MLKKLLLIILLFIFSPTPVSAFTCTDPSNFTLSAPSGSIDANTSLTFSFQPSNAVPWDETSNQPLYLQIYLQQEGATSSLYQTIEIYPPYTSFTLGTGIPTNGTYNALITDSSTNGNFCSNLSNSFTIINGESEPEKCVGLGQWCCIDDPLFCVPAEGHEQNKCCTLCYPETTYCDLAAEGPGGSFKGLVKTLENTTCGEINTPCCTTDTQCYGDQLKPEIDALGNCTCIKDLPPDDNSSLKCSFNGHTGIDTAIGCIPVDDLNAFLNFIFTWGIGIAGGISTLLIIYGSFQLISSHGDRYKTQAGRELITAAIAGLIFLLFSIWFIRTVGADILQLADFS